MTGDLPPHEVSSGNVFADLSFPDAEEALAKSNLSLQIAAILERRRLTQTEAAMFLGITQPRASNLLSGRLSGFSMGKLMQFLVALDQDVEILVKDKP